MNVRFEVQRLPVVHDIDSIRAALTRLATTDLPALVIRNTGATLEEACEVLTPPLGELSIDQQQRMRFTFDRVNQSASEVGLHVDSLPVAPGQTHINLNVHHTARGVVQADFLAFQPPFLRDPITTWQQKSSPLDDWFDEVEAQQGLFGNGQVDDTYLVPRCHRAIARPGTAIVFKEGLPLAHSFTSLQHPRTSRARLFSMPILPGLGITRCEYVMG